MMKMIKLIRIWFNEKFHIKKSTLLFFVFITIIILFCGYLDIIHIKYDINFTPMPSILLLLIGVTLLIIDIIANRYD